MFFGNNEEIMLKAAEFLKADEIVAIPTETVYGLAANALSKTAVEKIFKAKGRPADNPLILHISKLEDIEKYAYTTELAKIIASRFWPGPLTIILKKRDCVPDIVTAGLDTVAIRLPDNETARKIIELAGLPLAAPSANLSGRPSPTKAEHVFDDYNTKVDENGKELIAGIIDGGECSVGIESTVISLYSDTPMLLRPGFVTLEELRKYIPNIRLAKAVTNKMPKGEQVLSPGLSHRHYAPAAETEGVVGHIANAAEYINSCYDIKKNQAIMCFEGEESFFNSGFYAISYGSPKKPEDMAKNLFDILRELDKKGFEKIFIRIADLKGIGLAVYNRLIRACNFNIKSFDKKPLVIGITGQSGAGKGSICKLLEKEGFYHIDTDIIAGETLKITLPLLEKAFNKSFSNPDGTPNKKEIAKTAFSSEDNVKILNKISHTAIMDKVEEIINAKKEEGLNIIIDGAALFEAKAENICDKIISVLAPQEIRLKRVVLRDKISESEALLRFSRQLSEDELKAKSDFWVNNTSENDVENAKNKILDFLKYNENERDLNE